MDALTALLSCCANGELEAVTLSADTLTFSSGAAFPRSTPVSAAGVTRPLDELLVLARSSARSSGGANLAAYVKARSLGPSPRHPPHPGAAGCARSRSGNDRHW